MDEVIQAFERYVKRQYPNSSTAKHYVNDVQHFQKFIGDGPHREMTRRDISGFVEDQLAQGRSATTVNRRLASLRRFFEFLAEEADDDTWANPVVWHHHRVKEGKALPGDINDPDVERLFACIDHPRDHLMFSLMCWAGLRVGEVANLRVGDLIPPINLEEGARLRVLGKGEKERVVPLTVALTQEWAEWIRQRPEVESDAVFITRRKRGISVRGIEDRLTHHARQAGVDVSCHRLRHTFGRWMAEAVMPLPSLAKVLGHAQVTTTQIYIAGAGVDVRADYEAAMSRLEAECPGSPLFPAAGLELAEKPIGPRRPDTDAGGAAVKPAERSEGALDVSRLRAGLPAWLTDPLAEHVARQQRRWKPSQVAHHTRARVYTLRQVWRWLTEEREVGGFGELERRDVEAYVEARLQDGIAASTLNRQLRDLWSFLRFVEGQGQSISPGVFRVARLKERKPLPQFLAEEAYRRLEAHVLSQTTGGTRDDRLDQAWFYLLAHGGLRLGEVCDLELGNVDLVGRRLTVRDGKGKRDRIIPLSDTTVTVLGKYLAVRGEAQTNHVLIYDQAAIRPRLVEDRLARYGAAVGMRVWPHRLRHTLATRLVNIGMDIVSIQHLLGHEKLETTMIYAHVYDATVEQDFRQAMARLAARFESRSAAQTEPIPLEEEFFAHTRESVCTTTQAPNCV